MARMIPVFRKWLIAYSVFLLLGVAAGGAAVGALIGYLETMPPLDSLDNYNPAEVSRIYDKSDNKQIDEVVVGERRELVKMEDVPEHVANAFIAIEDERFYQHLGVDPEAIGRIVMLLAQGRRPQGASTITMQVARNIVLDDRRRIAMRKFREMLVSLQMERHFSKRQILEFYINHIFYGARSYGLQAAARSYFNKDVKDLTVPEAAMLAGLPQAPSNLSPFNSPENAKRRRDLVLGNMRKLGYIKTDEDFQRYKDTPIELSPPQRSSRLVPYFSDYVVSLLKRNDGGEQDNDLSRKGYSIQSTVDLQLQQILQEELSKALREAEKKIESQKEQRQGSEAGNLGSLKVGQARLARIKDIVDGQMICTVGGVTFNVTIPKKPPYFDPQSVIRKGNLIDIYIEALGRQPKARLYDQSHVQGAAVLLNAKNGEILALVGGDDYSDAVNNGQWNRAVQGGRQPGSCWKPLLFAAAFDVAKEDGSPRFTPGTVVIDEPITIGNWTPKNYEKRHYGATTLYEALVKSRNIPTILLFREIGASKAVDLYQKFKLVDKTREWKLPAVAPMALGTLDATPLELAAAYAVFANAGKGVTPTPMKRIVSAKNPSESRIVRPESVQVLSPQAAFITTRILMDVVKSGTAKATVGKWLSDRKAKGLPTPEVAGKTGTTNDCFVAWFVGYTPDLVLAIYVGYDQHRTMGPEMVGGKTIGPIWTAAMDRILSTRTDWTLKFPAPPGIKQCDICSKSGKLAASSCYSAGTVYAGAAFKEGTEPTETCSSHGGMYPGEGEEYMPETGYDTRDPGMQYAPQQQAPTGGGWFSWGR